MRESSRMLISKEAEIRISENKCPSCDLPKSQWTRTTRYRCCSKKCTDFFYKNHIIAYGWNDLRIKIFDRDNRRCNECKVVFPYNKLDADHIKPIAAGGKQWDLNNIQTLCNLCHKAKTKSDHKDISHYKKNQKILKKALRNMQLHHTLAQDGKSKFVG